MKCQACGRKNAWQAQFCNGCGAALEPPAPPPRPAELGTGGESSRWIVAWTIVVLLIVGAFCLYAFRPEGHFQGAHAPDPDTISGVPRNPGGQ